MVELTEEEFDEHLDSAWGDVKVCGIPYSTSRVLKEIDHVAYREAKLDYEDSLSKDEEHD